MRASRTHSRWPTTRSDGGQRNRISTKDFFQALMRLKDDSVKGLIE